MAGGDLACATPVSSIFAAFLAVHDGCARQSFIACALERVPRDGRVMVRDQRIGPRR